MFDFKRAASPELSAEPKRRLRGWHLMLSRRVHLAWGAPIRTAPIKTIGRVIEANRERLSLRTVQQ
ncbi:hypothetical protein RugamoR57_30470 [Duganella caerulea]